MSPHLHFALLQFRPAAQTVGSPAPPYPAGVSIFARILEALAIPHFRICGWGLREGILLREAEPRNGNAVLEAPPT